MSKVTTESIRLNDEKTNKLSFVYLKNSDGSHGFLSLETNREKNERVVNQIQSSLIDYKGGSKWV